MHRPPTDIPDLFSPLLNPPSWALNPGPSELYTPSNRLPSLKRAREEEQEEYRVENQEPVKSYLPQLDPLFVPPRRIQFATQRKKTKTKAKVVRVSDPLHHHSVNQNLPNLNNPNPNLIPYDAHTQQLLSDMCTLFPPPPPPPPILEAFTFIYTLGPNPVQIPVYYINGLIVANGVTLTPEELDEITASLKPKPKPKPSTTAASEKKIMGLITSFIDHNTRLSLRATCRGIKETVDDILFDHAAILAVNQVAVLTTPRAPFYRLPIDRDAPIIRKITVLDILKVVTYPPRYIPLPLLRSALDNTQITLVRAERFKVTPPARRTVLHVIPPDIQPGQANSDRVIWHPYTSNLLDCLQNLEDGRVWYADLTIVLDHNEIRGPVLKKLGKYLVSTRGKLTVVCGRDLATGLGVPLGYTSDKATELVRQRLREEGAGEAAERFELTFDLEWNAHALLRERRMPVYAGEVRSGGGSKK
ncbi:uncharacterized protein CcaverHIS019_0208250 [Cutaneotrichosporon cavernicola]|uniref:Uncharacterized protein n=1 Tax=Cutaneotrichosporon cavernicola TaxID=279322 RepID=A0AA48IIL1_9TREE|nr:uncharacterized protein CcaverHIS019_0208250 [Cutaneotrichosporon cavernicola]BEI89463.1 hypothetical protein CcaverHIS019_0208250 [Cutaneotrichosporon cavernicola]BEI97236.1 hypothetical protein CcaverHIS631_0208250 [Cutaneotrichosporon cavernicola]BEJ05010.1 hypothetical protein CcaverHIS641_0208270 [Cutaneotrichosporon cavernicola]